MIRNLRQYLRANKEYPMEYSPFPLSGLTGPTQCGVIKNISGGGLMFHADEDLPIGLQLTVKLHIHGWRIDGDEAVETGDEKDVMPLTAIVEITRCQQCQDGRREVGAKFVGRIL